jgi:hypothetical protein
MTTEQVLGFFVKPFDILKFATFLSKVGTSWSASKGEGKWKTDGSEMW